MDADRCVIGLPKWIWTNVLAPLFVMGCVSVFGWLWSLQTVQAAHQERLVEHAIILQGFSDTLKRIEKGVDELRGAR